MSLYRAYKMQWTQNRFSFFFFRIFKKKFFLIVERKKREKKNFAFVKIGFSHRTDQLEKNFYLFICLLFIYIRPGLFPHYFFFFTLELIRSCSTVLLCAVLRRGIYLNFQIFRIISPSSLFPIYCCRCVLFGWLSSFCTFEEQTK